MIRQLSILLLAAGLPVWAAGSETFTWDAPTSVGTWEDYDVSVSWTSSNFGDLYKGYYIQWLDSGNGSIGPISSVDTEAGEALFLIEVWDAFETYIESYDEFHVTVVPDTTPPSVPAGLNATNIQSTSLTLNWTASTDNKQVAAYQVKRDSTVLPETTSTSQNLTGLTATAVYSLRVRARDLDSNWSEWSAPLQVLAPSVPANVAASSITSSSFTLSWSASTDNTSIASYEVRRNEDIVAVINGSPPAVTCNVTGLTQGRTYQMRVRAKDTGGNWSDLSSAVPVTTTTPFGSTNITITNATYGTATIIATNSITANTNVTVNSGGNAKYVAGNRITLGPGFRANSGSTFTARVGADDTDTDGDGMSDLWELTNGLNPNSATDALTDNDSDGFSNVAEYNLKMDPAAADITAAATGGSLPAVWPFPDPNRTEAVGITAGELSISPSGAANYSIPLWVSPGTAGMEPKLTLNYSSQGGGGVLGFGWALGGLSAVTRGPKTLAVDGVIHGVDFTSADRFYLDGQRLIDVSGTYGADGTEYRTEIDSFSRVISKGSAGTGPQWFQVWTKAGLIIEFGNTSDSRLMAGSTVRAWAVSRISDTFGNYMSFTYTTGGTGEQLLQRIDYTGHAGSPTVSPYASVRFEYESRSDTFSGYVRGFLYESTKRLKYVRSYYGEIMVRAYTLGYVERSENGRSMLVSLTESGSDGTPLSPLTFSYQGYTPGWSNASGHTPPAFLAENNDPVVAGFMDLNGDGRPDLIRAKYNSSNQVLFNSAWLNTTTGWAQAHGSGGMPDYRLPSAMALAWDGRTDSGTRFADLNGDGLVDVLICYKHNNGTYDSRSYLNTGSGWQEDTSWALPTAAHVAEHNQQDRGVRIIDVNGDGLVDLIWNRPGSSGCYLNNAHGQIVSGGGKWISSSGTYGNYAALPFETAKGTRFLDVNGDGLPDEVQNWYGSTKFYQGVALNTGSGWNTILTNQNSSTALTFSSTGSTRFLAPVMLNTSTTGNGNAPIGTEAADLNGDGLVDLIRRNDAAGEGYPNQAYFNTGDGWVAAPSSFLAPYELSHDHDSRGTALIDLNGDGMADIVKAWGSDRDVRFGRGIGWGSAAGSSYHLKGKIAQSGNPSVGNDLVDLNGDGAVDQIWYWKQGSASHLGAWLNLCIGGDRLAAVTNGFGVTAQLEYKPLTDTSVYTKATDLSGIDSAQQPYVTNVIGPMYVVSKVRHEDGTGGTYDMTYTYGGLRAHRLHGSLGFAWTSVLDTRTNILSTTEFAQNRPFVGSPVETFTQTNGGSGTLLAESVTTLDQRTTTNGSGHKIFFPFSKDSVSKSYDLDGGMVSATKTITQRGSPGDSSDFDTYGNSKYIEVQSAVSFTNPNNPDFATGYKKVTVNTYDNTVSATKWHLGRLNRTTVASSGPGVSTLTRISAFGYDATSGVLTDETVEPDSSDDRIWLRTKYEYDAFGNKTAVIVENLNAAAGTAVSDHRRKTVTEYDSIGRFVTHVTRVKNNAANLADEPHRADTTTIQHWGVTETATDENDLGSGFWYDSFARLIRTDHPDGTYTTTSRKWAYGNAPVGALYYVQTQMFSSSDVAITAPAVEFFDKYGRSIRKLAVNGDGRAVATDTLYDSFGRAYRGSAPFYADSSALAWTETTAFDLLGRPLTVRTPDDETDHAPNGYVTTTYQYGSRAVTGSESGVIGTVGFVTSPRGVTTRTKTNSQGWTVEILQNSTNVDLEATNVEQATVTKSYDALGQLTETNAAGTVVTNSYDIRGRRTKTKDPNMGTPGVNDWDYQYNAFGDLTWQKDAAGNVTTMAYDYLGRLKTRLVTAVSSTYGDHERTEWVYDTASGKGVGQLHYVETYLAGAVSPNFDYKELNAYDSLARPSTVTRTISGTAYTTTLQYDAVSRLHRTIYPATGFTTENRYNSFGVLKEIRRVDGGRNEILWMTAPSAAYNAAGALEQYYLGNGVSTSRVYSAATGRIRAIDTGKHFGAAIQALDYNYDQAGNVNQRYNDATGQYDVAQYDALNRLAWQFINDGIGATPTQIQVNYAANGNITHKSDVGSYTYGGPRPNAVTATTGGDYAFSDYAYDANGNMTAGAGRVLQWSAFNQVRKIIKAGQADTVFKFGAAHERVRQDSGKGITIYVGSLYEKFTPPAAGYDEHWHWIMTPAGRVAVHKQRTTGISWTQWFHHDGLGSVVAATNEWGTLIERHSYDAWGKRYDPESPGANWATTRVTWSTNPHQLTRGFTDHEHLDDLGLIHMNGRVYDPVLGRFLSADPNIDGVEDSQGFNRYTYVHNNPLNETDPSGYLSLKDIGKIFAVVVAAVVTAGAALYAYAAAGGFAFSSFGAALAAVGTPSALLGVSEAAAVGFGLGFGSGFAGSLLNGGSIGDAFKNGLVGGVIGGITAGLSYGIGQSSLSSLEKSVAHAGVGGVAAEVQGGEFRHGFISSFATTALMHSSPVRNALNSGDRGFGWVAFRTSVAATVGGTVSAISGGKFANGAVTSAFQHLFNQESGHRRLNFRDAKSGVTRLIYDENGKLIGGEGVLVVREDSNKVAKAGGREGAYMRRIKGFQGAIGFQWTYDDNGNPSVSKTWHYFRQALSIPFGLNLTAGQYEIGTNIPTDLKQIKMSVVANNSLSIQFNALLEVSHSIALKPGVGIFGAEYTFITESNAIGSGVLFVPSIADVNRGN